MAKYHRNSPPTLFCTLVEAVITEQGDFVPAGTPVQVLQWSSETKRASSSANSALYRVLVRTLVHMHSDGVTDNKACQQEEGAIGSGLHLCVSPWNLKYLKFEA